LDIKEKIGEEIINLPIPSPEASLTESWKAYITHEIGILCLLRYLHPPYDAVLTYRLIEARRFRAEIERKLSNEELYQLFQDLKGLYSAEYKPSYPPIPDIPG